MASLRSFKGPNTTFLLALMVIGSPVARFRAVRSGSFRTSNVPSPLKVDARTLLEMLADCGDRAALIDAASCEELHFC